MLVLSRKQGQEIVIGDNVRITILKSRGNTVRVGIEAPRDVKVVRGELETHDEPDAHSETEGQIQDGAEFTVVFSQDADTNVPPNASNERDHHAGSVKFNTNHHSRRPTQTAERSNGSERREETVQFRSRLPKTLHRNRLKDFVDQIAADRSSQATID